MKAIDVELVGFKLIEIIEIQLIEPMRVLDPEEHIIKPIIYEFEILPEVAVRPHQPEVYIRREQPQIRELHKPFHTDHLWWGIIKVHQKVCLLRYFHQLIYLKPNFDI